MSSSSPSSSSIKAFVCPRSYFLVMIFVLKPSSWFNSLVLVIITVPLFALDLLLTWFFSSCPCNLYLFLRLVFLHLSSNLFPHPLFHVLVLVIVHLFSYSYFLSLFSFPALTSMSYSSSGLCTIVLKFVFLLLFPLVLIFFFLSMYLCPHICFVVLVRLKTLMTNEWRRQQFRRISADSWRGNRLGERQATFGPSKDASWLSHCVY